MAYSGQCLCGNIKYSFEYDPMMHFQCHCNTCQGVWGTSLSALAMPKHELTTEGEISTHSITGGSGMGMHYYFCSNCGVKVYNEPELLGGMIYIPAGALYNDIEFNPTVELWSGNRPKWMQKAPTIIESFEDNGTVERITELLENLDQRG